jgi:hypothetical protein
VAAYPYYNERNEGLENRSEQGSFWVADAESEKRSRTYGTAGPP